MQNQYSDMTSPANELDQEKVTGDFDREPLGREMSAVPSDLQIYHANSYVDTYDPTNKEDMYTNTDPRDTMPPSESDFDQFVSSSTSRRAKQVSGLFMAQEQIKGS